MVRLTDHPDMTLDVYRGCKTTKQQQQKKIIYSRRAITSVTGESTSNVHLGRRSKPGQE